MSNKKLPSYLEKEFNSLDEEFKLFHFSWKSYKELYASSKERIKLLNESASTFFYLLQIIMVDDIVIKLCKLDDPEYYINQSTGKQKRNLSLETICNIVNSQNESTLSKTLSDIRKKFSKKISKINALRNRKIAHFDYNSIVNAKAFMLPKSNFKDIDDILSLVSQFMNSIKIHYIGSETIYDMISSTHDASKLIHCLKESHRYRELKKEPKIDHLDLSKSEFFDI